MTCIILFTLFGYVFGAIPFAYLIGKFFVRRDIRQVGDGNPGGANIWIAGGWRIGLLTIVIEILKGFVPVYLARRAGLSDWSLIPVMLAPILGHGTQPFLGFRGGKALGATGGAWIGIIGLWVFPIFTFGAVPLMILQKENAYSAAAGMLALTGYAIFLNRADWVITFSILNTLIILWTHRKHLRNPIVPRAWLSRIFTRRDV
jgi:acyl-phosphate glycerol 3-phosphate acyltransferase